MFYEKIDYSKIPLLAKKMDTFFCSNPSTDKTAYMNWRISFHRGTGEQFFAISEGYAESAINLINECLNDNSDKKADAWIFPILHCIVHSIELALKAIIFHLEILLEEQPSIEGNHDIKQLNQTAISKLIDLKLKKIYGGLDEAKTALRLIEKFINNIYEKTDDMSFVRYPITAKKEDMFYTKDLNNVVVDLEKLKEQYSYVFTMLDFVIDVLLRNLEFRSEIADF